MTFDLHNWPLVGNARDPRPSTLRTWHEKPIPDDPPAPGRRPCLVEFDARTCEQPTVIPSGRKVEARVVNVQVNGVDVAAHDVSMTVANVVRRRMDR